MNKNKPNEKRIEGLSCNCGHCHERDNQTVSNNYSFVSQYRFEVLRIIISLILFCIGFFVSNTISLIVFVISAFIVGYGLILDLVKNIINLKFFNENALMLIASVTAFVLGEFFEGALIVLLYFIGEFLEEVAYDNSKRKIAGLSHLKSNVVHLVLKNGIQDVLPQDVDIGSFIEVKSGEIVPIDGELVGLANEFDMKSITGESKHVIINNGGVVYSGAINVGNPVIIKTTKRYKDSTVEQIINMVEGSLAKKAKAQKFITTFAKVYTPVIFGLAIFIATIPPLIDQMNFVKWIYKALSFIVISCPCALVISVPLSFFIGIGCLAKRGIMIKGSSFIERLTRVKTVVFDKTGTLTYGNFVICNVESFNEYTQDEILDYAASIEAKSNHPIARAILGRYKGTKKVDGIREIAGKGLCGKVNNKDIYIGNNKLMNDIDIFASDDFEGTIVYVAIDSCLAGKIFIADKIKENSSITVKNLNKLGVENTIMLSGDSKKVVEIVQGKIGIDKAYAELLPSEKLDRLKEIKNDNAGSVLFCGDGINDSPSLAFADIGVAMGAIGSELASSAADVVIMDDDINKISTAIKHSKKVKNIVWQNIIGSLSVKFTIMLLSILISVPVWMSMLADVGVMLLAVCNSFRCSRLTKK